MMVLLLACSSGYAHGLLLPTSDRGFTFLATPRRRCMPANVMADVAETEGQTADTLSITSPLRQLGPYPAICLAFPNLATAEQQERGDRGVSLDFVVDTAANVNTINSKVANDLGLPVVGSQEGGVSAGGTLAGGATYMLGDVELGDLSPADRDKFMSGMTASALPVASPSGAGLLGVPFLFAFPGGVEFRWGAAPVLAGAPVKTEEDPQATTTEGPSLTFYGDSRSSEGRTDGMAEVPAEQLPESGLVRVIMTLNGVDIPALLDTGSPITVLNAAAAEVAGVATPPPPQEAGMNPLAAAKAALESAQAMARGDLVMIGGANGPVGLRKIPEKVPIALGPAQIGAGRPYVGELPGLAALDGLGADAGPAAVLGMDVLRQRERLVLREGRVFV